MHLRRRRAQGVGRSTAAAAAQPAATARPIGRLQTACCTSMACSIVCRAAGWGARTWLPPKRHTKRVGMNGEVEAMMRRWVLSRLSAGAA